MHNVFAEISLVIVLAGTLGIALHILRQPPIIGYILTGLVIGPLGYLQLNNAGTLSALSEIGITLLLFMVGLELSLKDLRHIGKVAVILGITQVAVMVVLGAGLAYGLGGAWPSVLYFGLAAAFSSTILAVKLLSEKKDLDSLYGKLVLGILVVQDVIAIVALALITGLGSATESGLLPSLAIMLAKLILLFGLALLAGRKILPWMVERMARSSELIFLFALAWGLGFATLVSKELFNLTPEIGGFLAGLTLANTPQHLHIANRMKPLRDFFLILFFILLGSKLVFENLAGLFLGALALAGLGIIAKPVVTFLLLFLTGYKGRTNFLVSSSLAHISEFSIIIAVLGVKVGHLAERELSLITLATIFSFLAASYIMTHNQSLAKVLRVFLSWWDPPGGREENNKVRKLRGHVVLIGAHRAGHNILNSLTDMHRKFMVVDFNPLIVKSLKERNINALFGDISDPEIQEKANIEKAKLVISTVPDYNDNLSLIEAMNNLNPNAKVVLWAADEWEADKLYDRGADYVLMPHFLGGLKLAEMIRKDINLKDIDKLKNRDLQIIKDTL